MHFYYCGLYRFALIQDPGSIDCTDEAGKIKHPNDNPFIEPVHGQAVVDMKGITFKTFFLHFIDFPEENFLEFLLKKIVIDFILKKLSSIFS